MFGDFLEVGKAAVGAAAEEGHVDLDPLDGGAGGELHVLDRLGGGVAILLGKVLGVGDRLVDEDGLTRGNAPGDGRQDLFGAEVDDVVVNGVLVGGDRLPARDGGVPLGSRGGVGAAAKVFEGGLVRVHVTDPCPALDRHVADGHPLFLAEGVEGRAAVLVGVADAAVHPELADDVQDDVLGVDARGELPVDVDPANLGLADRHGLGREHVADLARADAEGNGTEGPVGRGVGIAAGNGGAWLGDALLGADDVDDPLLAGGKVEKGHAGLGAVPAEFLDHRVGEGVRERFGALVGRDDVVDGRERAVGIENLQAEVAEHAESLGARHLVDEVGADQKLGPTVGERANGMFLPDLIKKRFAHSRSNLA